MFSFLFLYFQFNFMAMCLQSVEIKANEHFLQFERAV